MIKIRDTFYSTCTTTGIVRDLSCTAKILNMFTMVIFISFSLFLFFIFLTCLSFGGGFVDSSLFSNIMWIVFLIAISFTLSFVLYVPMYQAIIIKEIKKNRN